MSLYLRVAPELHLKRLVIGGLAEKLLPPRKNLWVAGLGGCG